jgi:hypothetical protein
MDEYEDIFTVDDIINSREEHIRFVMCKCPIQRDVTPVRELKQGKIYEVLKKKKLYNLFGIKHKCGRTLGDTRLTKSSVKTHIHYNEWEKFFSHKRDYVIIAPLYPIIIKIKTTLLRYSLYEVPSLLEITTAILMEYEIEEESPVIETIKALISEKSTIWVPIPLKYLAANACKKIMSEKGFHSLPEKIFRLIID